MKLPPISSLQQMGPGALEGWSLHTGWPTCMDAHVILVVGGTGEATATVGFRAGVGPFARMGAHMDLADVGCGKGAAAALKRTPEWAFTCADQGCEGGSGSGGPCQSMNAMAPGPVGRAG